MFLEPQACRRTSQDSSCTAILPVPARKFDRRLRRPRCRQKFAILWHRWQAIPFAGQGRCGAEMSWSWDNLRLISVSDTHAIRAHSAAQRWIHRAVLICWCARVVVSKILPPVSRECPSRPMNLKVVLAQR